MIHKQLIKLQSDSEIKRKALKSRCRSNIWTQEELDYAERSAVRLGMDLDLEWAYSEAKSLPNRSDPS